MESKNKKDIRMIKGFMKIGFEPLGKESFIVGDGFTIQNVKPLTVPVTLDKLSKNIEELTRMQLVSDDD